MMRRSEPVQDLETSLIEYCNAAAGTGDSDAKTANHWYERLRNCRKQLWQSDEGKNAITGLLGHENRHVRCAAAVDSLFWDPEKARQALEELRDSDGPCSFEAKMVLSEFDKGRLSFDY